MKLIVNDYDPLLIDVIKRYCVLIPIIEDAGKYYILFERRSTKLDTQPGDVCFPGGGVHEGETLEECAIRECHEELGIDIADIEIINKADFYFLGDGRLDSFIGKLNIKLKDVEHLNLNSDEVDEVFVVPLEYFMDTPPNFYMLRADYQYPNDFPFDLIQNGRNYKFRFNKHRMLLYQYEDRVIWGMTAKLIHAASKRFELI